MKEEKKTKKEVVADVATNINTTENETVSRVLRTHATSYVAQKKASHEAIVTVCFARTGKRVTLSVSQLRKELKYDGSIDWLDIQYDDAGKAVLIGKKDIEEGIKPIVTDKKYIIYDILTVTDFKDTLNLDFSKRSSISAYTFSKEKIDGRDFIVLSHKDFE